MIHIGQYIEAAIEWLTDHFAPFFDVLNIGIGGFISGFQEILFAVPLHNDLFIRFASLVQVRQRNFNIYPIRTTTNLWNGLWKETMETLALVLSSSFIALLLGIPLGIWTANNNRCQK